MIIKCPENALLKEYLRKQGASLLTACGGRGNCGKCVVRVVEGEVPANTMDRAWFTGEQLQEGYRLGCQVYTKEAVVVEVQQG